MLITYESKSVGVPWDVGLGLMSCQIPRLAGVYADRTFHELGCDENLLNHFSSGKTLFFFLINCLF
jgi:hypothetical protein